MGWIVSQLTTDGSFDIHKLADCRAVATGLVTLIIAVVSWLIKWIGNYRRRKAAAMFAEHYSDCIQVDYRHF